MRDGHAHAQRKSLDPNNPDPVLISLLPYHLPASFCSICLQCSWRLEEGVGGWSFSEHWIAGNNCYLFSAVWTRNPVTTSRSKWSVLPKPRLIALIWHAGSYTGSFLFPTGHKLEFPRKGEFHLKSSLDRACLWVRLWEIFLMANWCRRAQTSLESASLERYFWAEQWRE